MDVFASAFGAVDAEGGRRGPAPCGGWGGGGPCSAAVLGEKRAALRMRCEWKRVHHPAVLAEKDAAGCRDGDVKPKLPHNGIMLQFPGDLEKGRFARMGQSLIWLFAWFFFPSKS